MKRNRVSSISAAVAGLFAVAAIAFAGVPSTVNFQGYLKNDDGTPVTASTGLRFSIYSSVSGVNPLWSETQTVAPANGTYSVQLGRIVPLTLPFDRTYFLGIAAGRDQEMRPLQPFDTVPYARRAAIADAVTPGAVGAAAIADTSITAAKILDGAVTGSKIGTGAVTAAKIASAAITSDGVARGAVTADKLSASAVTTEKIVDGAITGGKIASGAVTDAHIAAPISALKLDGSGITTTRLTYWKGAYANLNGTEGPRKLQDVGTFFKKSPLTNILAILNSHVQVSDTCTFHLRVDGQPAPNGHCAEGACGAVVSAGGLVPVSPVEVFTGLTAGDHTVSIWAWSPRSTSCFDNPGNFGRDVFIFEY